MHGYVKCPRKARAVLVISIVAIAATTSVLSYAQVEQRLRKRKTVAAASLQKNDSASGNKRNIAAALQEATGGSGGGAETTTSQHSALQPHIYVVYPTDSAARNPRLQHIGAGQPASRKREGIYLWADSARVWHLDAVAAVAVIIEGRIRADAPVSTAGGRLGLFDEGREIRFRYEVPIGTSELGTFSVAADAFQFDVLLDGVPDVSKIFLGPQAANPDMIPLQVHANVRAGQASPTIRNGNSDRQSGQGGGAGKRP